MSISAKEFNDRCKREDALEAWSLEEVFKRLIDGDKETIVMVSGKELLARDQYGQIGEAYLASNLNGKLIVTTKEDLV